jgi:hypothetical protein
MISPRGESCTGDQLVMARQVRPWREDLIHTGSQRARETVQGSCQRIPSGTAALPHESPDVWPQSRPSCSPFDCLAKRGRPCMCENVRAPFSCVNFSHVEAISGDLLHRIRLLAILRGGRNEFLHSLGRLQTVQRELSQFGPEEQPFVSIQQVSQERTAECLDVALPFASA